MDWAPVTNSNSGNITHIGYDATASTLGLRFANPKPEHDHHFFAVPVEHHTGLLNAESIGKYFHQHIKGKFEFKKVERPKEE